MSIFNNKAINQRLDEIYSNTQTILEKFGQMDVVVQQLIDTTAKTVYNAMDKAEMQVEAPKPFITALSQEKRQCKLNNCPKKIPDGIARIYMCGSVYFSFSVEWGETLIKEGYNTWRLGISNRDRMFLTFYKTNTANERKIKFCKSGKTKKNVHLYLRTDELKEISRFFKIKFVNGSNDVLRMTKPEKGDGCLRIFLEKEPKYIV